VSRWVSEPKLLGWERCCLCAAVGFAPNDSIPRLPEKPRFSVCLSSVLDLLDRLRAGARVPTGHGFIAIFDTHQRNAWTVLLVQRCVISR
jgi:hypothetical protein